jgi:glycosyl transferase family 25
VSAVLPLVIVISLKRSEARRAVIAKSLENLNLAYEFFDGVDGYLLDMKTLPDYDSVKRCLFSGRDMTQGEIGCTLSHRGVFQRMVDRDIPMALVLEDDALLAADLPQVLQAIAELPAGWDMVRFLSRPKVYKNSRAVKPLTGAYELTRVFSTPGGAYGYVLTKHAAARLIEFMTRNWQPNDLLLGQTWRTGLNVYAVRPSPVTHDGDVASTIGDARFIKKTALRGWMKAAYPFTRAGFRLWETAGKYAAWWRDKCRDGLAPLSSWEREGPAQREGEGT